MTRGARRQWLQRAALWAAASPLAWAARPAQAPAGQPVMPEMTEGPFYPSRRWRGADADWDADLTRVTLLGQTRTARGEHLGLQLQLIDSGGREVDGAEVEIWQCDTEAIYRHPGQASQFDRADPGFQGFGEARSDAQGFSRFRTIRPVAYPGRTPHIHFKLRHPQFGELTSQLFVAGDPGNARDGLWRRLGAQGQSALAMRLQSATAQGLRWQVSHTLVVPA